MTSRSASSPASATSSSPSAWSLFLGATAYFGAWFQGYGIGGLVAVAIASWPLAEYFTRVRRMALPSIVLLVAFALSSFAAILLWLGDLRETGQIGGAIRDFGDGLDLPEVVAQAAFLTALLVALHYWRFRVPITVAAGVASLAFAVLASLAAAVPDLIIPNINLLVLVLGLAIFALAMRFDTTDTARISRRTDIAFWLHLLAAPMIVHPVISGIGTESLDAGRALLILATFLLLGIVSVVIDRRALLVSGLSYAGYAFGTLLEAGGLDEVALPATLLALGAFVLLLSAGWRPLRRVALGVLPFGLRRLLPGPSALQSRVVHEA